METSAATARNGSYTARSNNAARTADADRDAGGTGEWPVLPPVPTPTPPPPAHLGPEPPIINRGVNLIPTTAAAAPVYPYRVPLLTRPARVALRTRPVRRPMAVPSRAENQVWQARFAYIAAAVVGVGFLVVALPLLVALYRSAGAVDVHAGDVISLGMMLLGGFLTAVTAWVIVMELRSRVRMVDALGRTGEHEAPGTTGASYSGLLRPFAPVPAQVALLGVALALFVGATVITLA